MKQVGTIQGVPIYESPEAPENKLYILGVDFAHHTKPITKRQKSLVEKSIKLTVRLYGDVLRRLGNE